MARLSSWRCLLAATLLVAGCSAGGSPGQTTRKPSPTATATPPHFLDRGDLDTRGGGIVAAGGGNVVAGGGGNVVAGGGGNAIAANSAAAIVAGGGGNLVNADAGPAAEKNISTDSPAKSPEASDDSLSGNIHLTLPLDAPLGPGATLWFHLASGATMKAADGAPVAAIVDGTGHYRFAGPLPAHGVFAAVQVPPGLGTEAMAFSPRDAAVPRVADIDMVSALTCNYVLQAMIEPFGDREAQLDRLTAAAVGHLQETLRHALAADPEAAPTSYASTAMTQAVDRLRQGDAALGVELDAVRKLIRGEASPQ